MKPTDDDLVLYADDALDEQRKQRLLHAADHDRELAQILAALDASRLPYKAAFDQQPLPPIPAELRHDVGNLIKVSKDEQTVHTGNATRNRWYLPIAQAACVLLGVAVGYGLGIHKPEATVGATDKPTEIAQRDSAHIEWVNRVADYQTLYVPNTVSHITPDSPASRKKLDQIARSTGIQTLLPDLSTAGYQFVRVQELGYNGKPLIQLVYAKQGHTPLALCFMPAQGEENQYVRIGNRHGLGTASWIKDDQYYVIVAEEPAQTLNQLYSLVTEEGA